MKQAHPILRLTLALILVLTATTIQSFRHAGQMPHALAYAAGVLACFVAIAFVLLGLRHAGAAAGWGFQLQSPVFLAAMAWVLFAVGLNLSGVYEMGRAVGAGQSLARRNGLPGSFGTGLLAVLVATPCTAPFMGVAIAAGLAGTPATTVAT